MNFEYVPMNTVCRPKQWKTISSSNLKASGYPVYGANGIIGFNDSYTHENPTLMITCRGATCGTVNISKPKSYINGNAMALDSLDEARVHIKFLYYFFKQRGFRDVITGSAQPQITRQGLEKVQLPLPPLPIQKKIAAVLEKADTLRQQSQQMEQEFNSLAQSVFLDMFGDPKANPRGWEKRTLRQLVSKLVGGKSLAAPEEQDSEITNRVLKISAVTSGEFNPKESKPLPQDYCPPKDHYVKVNDLLFSRANTTELVGATCIVFETPENVCLPDKLWRFEWQEPEKLSQIFMWKLLNTPAMRNRLSEISSGSGGSMKNISKSKLLEMEVIFPDYDKQLEYEVSYLKLRRQMAMRDRYYIEAENIFNSLMQRAFTGELDLKDVA